MEHYFIDKEHTKDDFFEFTAKINDTMYHINSCNDIFSKDTVDYGSKLLIETIIKNSNLTGRVLDMCCGYGIIGIALANEFENANFVLTDINKTATELSKQNVAKNKINNIEKVVCADGYAMVDGEFDFVITNPPIKAGKQNLLNVLLGAKNVLKPNGELWFVIKKKHGEDSIKKTLEKSYAFVEVIKRDAGYYILRAVK